jgi:hypothetical protein
MSTSTIRALVSNLLVDNTTGQISAADMRQIMGSVADALDEESVARALGDGWSNTTDPEVPQITNVTWTVDTVRGIAVAGISWTAPPSADRYVLSVTIGGLDEVRLPYDHPKATLQIPSGVSFALRVLSINLINRRSAWSTLVTGSAPFDTVAPATPTGLSAIAINGSVFLQWDENTEVDIAEYGIFESTVNAVPPFSAAPTYRSKTASFTRSGLTIDTEPRYFCVRAYDTSGNKSAWSSTEDGTQTLDSVIEQGQLAFDAAEAVRQDHDALVDGFTGDLATAFAEQDKRANAAAGGYLKDPTFKDWSAGNLTAANWVSRTGTSTYALPGDGDFGGGMTVSVPSGTATVDIVASNTVGLVRAQVTADWAVYELDLEYISGNPAGTSFRVEWSNDGVTWTRGTIGGAASWGYGSDLGLVAQPGARQSIKQLWKRPSGVSGHIRMRIIPKLGTVNDAQNMVIHYANLRAATKADIDAGQEYLIASSTPGQTVAYTGASAAIAGMNSAFTARAGGLEANVTSILGARADLLAGTAFAALMTQLNVSAVGISAVVTQQASAIADLEGNASAMWGVKLTAGGVATKINFVAADDPTGPVSSGTFEMDNFIVRAKNVFFSGPGNSFPDYDMVDEDFYSTNTGATYSFPATSIQSLGQRFLRINADAAVENVYSDWFPIEPAKDYALYGAAWLNTTVAGGGTAQLYLQTASMDSAGILTLLSSYLVKQTVDTGHTGAAYGVDDVKTDATARKARWLMRRLGGGTQPANFGALRVQSKADANLVVDGSLTGRHIKTASLDASVIGAGEINARFINLDSNVPLGDIDAGFSMGKDSAVDFGQDGLYMGRTATSAGAMGFGFLMGKTADDGTRQYIQHTTDTGLSIVNAQYALLTDTATQSTITTSQTVILPVGTQAISLTVLGGGAGGRGEGGSALGTNGGATTVRLFNGTTDTGISWVSAGGTNKTTGGAESSLLGKAGASGMYVSQTTNFFTVIAGGNATGYGAGGGSGDSAAGGGRKSTAKIVNEYDVSAVANPRLVITIGAAGVGGNGDPSGTYDKGTPVSLKGGNGSPGVVKIASSGASTVPCGVIPLYPTAVGTFAKAANATGGTVFPNLGTGLWVISENSGAELCLNSLETDTLGTRQVLTNALTASFVANKRPVIITGNAAARTIKYLFYKMKV